MATTKTLTPTNQAITLAAFTEKPDNRTNVTNDDKLADAVNALNSNIGNLRQQDGTIINVGNADLNNRKTTSFVYIGGSGSNLPVSGTGGYVATYALSDSLVKQEFFAVDSNRTFVRYLRNGTWSSWEELAMASDLIKSHGTIAQNITYEKIGKIVTIFINGVSVTAQSSWTLLADLPNDFAVRYSVHFKSMDGVEIQISGQTIKYRGSASSIYGATTYIAMT